LPTGFDVPFRLTAKYFEMEFVSLLIFKLKGDEINNPIIQIRAATLNDVPGIARVHVDVWNSTYTGIVPQEFLDSRTYENKTPQWQRIVGEAKPRSHVYVAVTETDEVVGFTSGGVNRDETYKFDSELYAIYLLKNHHSKGIGRRLFESQFKNSRPFGQKLNSFCPKGREFLNWLG